MLGAYFAYPISLKVGFWPALVHRARCWSGCVGAAVERYGLRTRAPLRPRRRTAVHLRPGLPDRGSGADDLGPARRSPTAFPPILDCPLFTLYSTAFPELPRLHDAGRAGDAGRRSGCADPHPHRPGDPGRADPPETVEALGHNVPRVFMLVFGGGCGAGRAGRRDRRRRLHHRARHGRLGRADRVRGRGGRRHGLARRRLHRLAADRRAADLLGRARLFARRPARRTLGIAVGPDAAVLALEAAPSRRRRRCCPTCCWC